MISSGVGLIERSAEPPRQFYCVIIGPKMHEEQARFFIKHVTVERRHFIGTDYTSSQRPRSLLFHILWLPPPRPVSPCPLYRE